MANVMYLDGNLVFYVIDSSIAFNTSCFLRDIKAYIVWEVLKKCWLNTYLGPLDVILVDIGINFVAVKFKVEV